MAHHILKVYKLYINYDPGMTLTYFTARSSLVSNAFKGGKWFYIIHQIRTCKVARNFF